MADEEALIGLSGFGRCLMLIMSSNNFKECN